MAKLKIDWVLLLGVALIYLTPKVGYLDFQWGVVIILGYFWGLGRCGAPRTVQLFIFCALISYFIQLLPLKDIEWHRLAYDWNRFTLEEVHETITAKKFSVFVDLIKERYLTGLSILLFAFWARPDLSVMPFIFLGAFLAFEFQPFLNPSLLACVCALTSVFLGPLSWLPLLWILFRANSSTAVLTALIVWGTVLWQRGYRWSVAIGVAFGFSMGVVFLPNFWGSDRWIQYRLFLSIFSKHSPLEWIFGMGAGTYELWGPRNQNALGATTDLYAWAHSDWLQVGISHGLVGLSVSLWLFAWAISHSRGQLQAAIMGYGCVMGFYYPTHSPMPFLIGVVFLVNVGRNNDCYYLAGDYIWGHLRSRFKLQLAVQKQRIRKALYPETQHSGGGHLRKPSWFSHLFCVSLWSRK